MTNDELEARLDQLESRLHQIESTISGAGGAIKLAAWATPICVGIFSVVVQIAFKFLS
jgi:hypothetical protein